ncbi:hypothetical protein C7T35_38055 [Variovorax sp. WS11]|uniref:hypothetical protein n=1 Tax=Variovorax sp. WS11 TaxID=1105204 RepID=UPI000D0D4D34|nr:hypothetical protein [Variovorax sp. WS11]NDZ19002.1 hypothetical protein [Variovorax sp. WS11]PSL79330.1 hypothetical protein C7T35_38055 [Variovorax sp. WS11]
MAVVMNMEWDGVTREQYEAVRKIVNFEGNAPAGGLFHVASFSDTGIRVTDLWQSAEDFQTFVEKRLMPGTKEAGIQGEPRVQIYPVHNLFTPGFRPL